MGEHGARERERDVGGSGNKNRPKGMSQIEEGGVKGGKQSGGGEEGLRGGRGGGITATAM